MGEKTSNFTYIVGLSMKKTTIKKPINRITPDPDTGLTESQVQERKDSGYSNIITDTGEKSTGSIIFHNLFTFFNTILMAIALLFLVFVIYLHATGHGDIADSQFGFSKFMFLIPALMNVAMGTTQELHSLKVIKKLRIVTQSLSKVVRDGEIQTIKADEVVIDDIVVLGPGDQASADLRVVRGTVSVDESMLTGESDYIQKGPGDVILSGSSIMVGDARAIAADVGDDTYAAKLSRKVKGSGRHKSELMTTIIKIIKFLSIMLVLVLFTVLFTLAFKVYRHGADTSLWDGMVMSLDDPVTWSRIMLTAGSFCVGIIPTGLVLTSSVTLLVSIVSLSRKETLIQELYSLENLSRVDVICLDKTGTLTDGTMKVTDVKGYSDYDTVVNSIRDLMAVTENKNPTATALNDKFGSSAHVDCKEIIPFSSATKYSGIVYSDGRKLLIGAPEYLLGHDDEHLEYVHEKASHGNRVIAVTLDGSLLAFVALEDHIRETAAATIKFFRDNGVTAKIISGDNALTVSKIAEACGVENADKHISLEGIPLEKIPEIAETYTVFARVSPEQKEALVSALQNAGHKVAMTGDGVNDLLALRKADSSITFAKATEAAKSCSDVVLLDNDFSHLEEVVAEGRRVIGNVQKTAILFLMKSIAIIICAFAMIPFAKGQMWFTIESSYMMEAAIIGVGGFLLSLEYQKEPIRGSFIHNITPKAIASGALAAIAILMPIIMYTAPSYYRLNPSISLANVPTMITILLSLAGFVVVLTMCLPFTKYRIFTVIAVLFVGSFLGMVFPTSYIGGVPTGVSMFEFDAAAGQTILDSQFFHELFQPWNSEVVRNVASYPTNFMIAKLFVFIAIPVFVITMSAINRSLEKEYGIANDEETRIRLGKTMLLISSLVLIISRTISIISDIQQIRGGDFIERPLSSVISLAFSLGLYAIYFLQYYSGYRVWKNGERRFIIISFIFAVFSLVVLTGDFIVDGINRVIATDYLTTADNVISLVITLLYIIGAFIVWIDNATAKRLESYIPKLPRK